MEPKTQQGGGPPAQAFSMPMFRAFVPRSLRPWIYVVLACCFQLSNGVYLGAMSHQVGELSLMREDLQMCLYATLCGMALYFPVLFRMKFRFTNRALLIGAAVVILLCNGLATLALPLPALWAVCVVCGMAKIQGTFECLSTIQLWMTPQRDFGVFFPVIHLVLLTAIEVASFGAAELAYAAHWTHAHWAVMALMLGVVAVQLFLTRPFRPMPRIVPLAGIDWQGALLWCVLTLQVAYILNYGDWLDWWNSATLRLLCGTALLTFAVCLQRMLHHPQPYFEPAMWNYRHVVPVILLIGVVEVLFSCQHVVESVYYGSVMHYAHHTSARLGLWSLPGIWAGCLFSLGWLKLMRWNVYKLIALALAVFSLYVGGFYFLVDSATSIDLLRLPIACRGFSYAVLSVAFMWCLHEIMSFQHFFQALAMFNVLHMLVGGLIGAALHAYGLRYYVADGFARYGGSLDGVRLGARHAPLGSVTGGLAEAFMAQGVKLLFGWTLFAALFFALLMLLWDIPMVRRQVKHVQEWPRVGVQVWNGFRRAQRLRRLRHARRAL